MHSETPYIVQPSGSLNATQLLHIEPFVSAQLEALRTSIARELHDALGAQLAGVAMLLGHLETSYQANPSLARHLAAISAQVHAAVATTRSIAHGLMPLGPEPDALWRALEHVAAQCTETGHLPCYFVKSGNCCGLPQDMGNQLLRIAQEALRNAVQHSGARSARIALRCQAAAGSLHISDNGHGFNLQPSTTAAAKRGLGLANIRARAQSIGAEISIDSSAQQGTSLRVAWQGLPAHKLPISDTTYQPQPI